MRKIYNRGRFIIKANMCYDKEKAAHATRANLAKYASGIRLWRWYWRGYCIITLITSLTVVLTSEGSLSLGYLIGGFVFGCFLFGVLYGFLAFVMHISYSDKMEARGLSWNVLSLAQEHFKRGDYEAAIKIMKAQSDQSYDSLLSSRRVIAQMAPSNFADLLRYGITNFDIDFWKDKDHENEHSPYALALGERYCYNLLWPLSNEQINSVLLIRPDIDGGLIKTWKSKVDSYYITERHNQDRNNERIARRAARTGEDYWEIADKQSDEFYKQEVERSKKREEKKEAAEQAQANMLYLGVTGRCPYCNKKISKAAVRCPYCTSMIR